MKIENDIINKILNDKEVRPSTKLAEHHQKFFKTAPGEYGEGDRFLGFTVPQIRKLEKKYRYAINLNNVDMLLHNNIHEIRLLALIYLTNQFDKYEFLRDEIVKKYLKNTKYINNWDLVDLSCYKIIGKYCFDINNYEIIFNLSKSENLWEQRISIVSTIYLIKNGNFDITLKLCKKFLSNEHHLIHKACGWTLREIGKNDKNTLLKFLNKYSKKMPKIMLSYAIEKIRNEVIFK